MKELIPILAAIIGLTPVILKWLNDRSKAAATHRTIQQAKEQVEFWQVWLQAQREVTSEEKYKELKSEVANRLDGLRLIGKEFSAEEKDEESEEGPGLLRRIFLLYTPHTGVGWILHTLFYMTIAFTFLFLYGSSLPTDNIDAQPSMAYLSDQLGFVLTSLIIYFIIAFILQRYATRAEKKYRKKIQEKREAKLTQVNN